MTSPIGKYLIRGAYDWLYWARAYADLAYAVKMLINEGATTEWLEAYAKDTDQCLRLAVALERGPFEQVKEYLEVYSKFPGTSVRTGNVLFKQRVATDAAPPAPPAE